MAIAESVELKNQVRSYWDAQPCGTQYSDKPRYSKEYFDEIEEHRYSVEPEIFEFAQFTRHHGASVLEVGVGAGSDFLQWVRAGAHATGVDATDAGVRHVQERLQVYGLECDRLVVADCESLPFEDSSFDVVYSWGVIHHTPDTPKALAEIVRVCKPGGVIKVMIYHRHSLLSYFFWIKYALLKGRPWKSLAWCLANYMESPGTQAFTRSEARAIVARLPVQIEQVRTVLTYYDRMERFGNVARLLGKVFSVLLGGDRAGWFLTMRLKKNGR